MTKSEGDGSWASPEKRQRQKIRCLTIKMAQGNILIEH